jgi:hypothetical protein
MPMVSLSFELDAEHLARVERLAAAKGVSLSQMVARLLRVVSAPPPDSSQLPPLTRNAIGILPPLSDEAVKQVLDEERMRKYGDGK